LIKNYSIDINQKKMRYQQKSRLDRIYSQTFYLIDQKSLNPNQHQFVVSGSTANLYKVTLKLNQPDFDQTVSCNCPDDAKKWSRSEIVKCKHCCFVLLKVLRLPVEWLELEVLNFDQLERIQAACRNLVIRSELTNQSYQEQYQKILNQKIKNGEMTNSGKKKLVLTRRDQKEKTNKFSVTKELDQEDDCPICFDVLMAANSFQCPTCRNVVHQACMKKWLSTGHKNCVYCRGDWSELLEKKKKQSVRCDAFQYDNLATN